MKKVLTAVVMFSLFYASIGWAQGLGGFSLPDLGAMAGKITVNPFVQAGFQHLGSNMDLPLEAEGPPGSDLQIEGINISMQDANFWTGTAGFTAKAGELLSVFASVGGSLNRPFVVSGQIPVSQGAGGVQPSVDFTASNLNSWYAQGGVGLGPILLGLYGAHFAVVVKDPRGGSDPLPNQTLRGDVISTALAPYIGLAIPAYNAIFTVMYSPLATSNTTLVLRTSTADLAQVQYKWNKPGNFVSCTFQYNTPPIRSVSFGIWSNYAWMDVRGNAQLDFQDITRGVFGQKQVTATMTQYVLQGGATLGIIF